MRHLAVCLLLVSSSTASAGSKHARDDEGEVAAEAPAKRQRQEDNGG